MTRPTALVTNDDGIESHFLRVLARALSDVFDVSVVAPAREQSWVSRRVTRFGQMAVDRIDAHTWRVDGTPTDCVNLALAELLPTPPDVVVSGINVGTNVSLPLIYSSGTVAAALEGAFFGLPALAMSLQLPPDELDAIRAARGAVDGAMADALEAAAGHAVTFARLAIDAPPSEGPVVHNVNFPTSVSPQTPVQRTRPAPLRLGGLFRPVDPEQYQSWQFEFPTRVFSGESPPDTDRGCVARGYISHSVLDFAAI